MSNMILIPGQPTNPQITLETRRGTKISNCQIEEISRFEQTQFPELDKKFPNIKKRTPPVSQYNCHGMTFASRRTCVTETEDIQKILDDDCYEEIQVTQVLPGDVILYFGPDGDLEHSGIVVSEPDNLKIPKICSKWGKYCEIIHPANHSPYQYLHAKFYRVAN